MCIPTSGRKRNTFVTTAAAEDTSCYASQWQIHPQPWLEVEPRRGPSPNRVRRNSERGFTLLALSNYHQFLQCLPRSEYPLRLQSKEGTKRTPPFLIQSDFRSHLADAIKYSPVSRLQAKIEKGKTLSYIIETSFVIFPRIRRSHRRRLHSSHKHLPARVM